MASGTLLDLVAFKFIHLDKLFYPKGFISEAEGSVCREPGNETDWLQANLGIKREPTRTGLKLVVETDESKR